MAKRPSTLKEFDDKIVGSIDGKIEDAVEKKQPIIYPTCYNCGKKDFEKILPVINMAGMELHKCLGCGDRVYIYI